MNRTKAWKKSAIVSVLILLFAAAVAPSISHFLSSSGHNVSSAYYDPIATGNWQQDQYDAIIVQQAQNHGLDPFVVKGQIMLESAFNPNAISPWGDLGLMQIKLNTADALGYSGSWSGIFDPWTNIYYGTTQLQHLVWQFGSVDLALQAYNIGSTAVSNGQRNWQYSSYVMSYAQQFRNEHASLYGSSYTPPTQSSSAGSSSTYTVQPGDTLYLISQKLGQNWQSIASNNGIVSPYTIYVGQHLILQRSFGGASSSTTYTVQPGDSLYSIGQRYGVSWQSVADSNGIGYPYILSVGEKLSIP